MFVQDFQLKLRLFAEFLADSTMWDRETPHPRTL